MFLFNASKVIKYNKHNYESISVHTHDDPTARGFWMEKALLFECWPAYAYYKTDPLSAR